MAPGQARGEGGKKRHMCGPADPKSLPLVRRPSQGSEVSPLLRKHGLSNRLGKRQSLSKIRHLISHLRITRMNEIPLAKCCLPSATAIKLSLGGKVCVEKLLGGRDWVSENRKQMRQSNFSRER